ncbi:MAG: hypothetical protein WC709_13150 [Thermoleophilia bacterium]
MTIGVALIHLAFATIWLGTDLYFHFVVAPQLRTLDASLLGSVTASLHRVTSPLLAASAVLTIVSGLAMMVQLHPDHPGAFSTTRWGTALLVGAVASILVVVIAVAVDLPAGKKLARLAGSVQGREATAGETAELRRHSERSILAGRVATVLLLVSLATMAVARYS